MKSRVLAAALAAALPLSLAAQTQQIKPPIAVYWMSVETAAGMGMGMPPGMGGLMPSSMAGGRTMKLDLGSSQPASGDPRASHAIPPGLAMGQSLPLLTPRIERGPTPREEPEERSFEKPKGRMLIYWGCGETVRTGQPVIVDFANLNSQDAARAFRSRAVSRPSGPAAGRNRSYGAWPNQEDARAVPAQGLLRGDQVIAGNYSPEIRFAVDERHDFMEAVAFDPVRKTAGGAFALKWKLVPTAIGYFATATGQGENQNDIVMWSSSEVQEMGQALLDYLPPAEVARLIRETVVMTPQTTECSVPAGIFKGEGAMLNFIAYGEELNVVHPPRPKDPKQVWEQQWAVKLRLKSTAMTMLAESEGRRGRAGATRRGAEPAQQEQAETPPAQAEKPKPPAPIDPVQEGVKVLRGILRF
ncbi:MAG: hypothetical protein A3I00_02885 [Betaproteobacteria bacterium RIFCSPLOWO2_02_FULL_64_12]|nr:MAG: hypothetical protein A3I00_02885 [Betaproteobacteria bacterium RIFCSPLOWO2_02_FULL_64_12]